MARGRHVKRSGLLSRLWPRRRRVAAVTLPASDDGLLRALQGELSRLRVLGIAHAAAAASADIRARRAQEQVQVLAEQLGQTRAQLNAVREELLWAFTEGRLPLADSGVIDLRAPDARSA